MPMGTKDGGASGNYKSFKIGKKRFEIRVKLEPLKPSRLALVEAIRSKRRL